MVVNDRTWAAGQLVPDEFEGLDPYSRRGVILSRDAAHCAASALRRDADSMRQRGGALNEAEAKVFEALADNIGKSLSDI